MSGKRKALIIAINEYEQEALSNLVAPAADAEALAGVLGDPRIGDFTVQVVRNEPSHLIGRHIEDFFLDSRSDDVLVLHFSGHGLKSDPGELFFAASDTRSDRLGSTAISADFVQRSMRSAPSRSIVLLLDCCYGGAFAQGFTARAAGDINVLASFPEVRSGGGRGRAVITASNAMGYAFEGDRLADDRHLRPSVFTSALVEGLATGDADQDEDGFVSLDELYDYVFDKVREQNPYQTPSRRIEMEGELYLARSSRGRIRSAPIPPELQAAIADQNMYTRRGAVHELESRLASEDLPVAVGAYQVLTEVARTDIQYIADLAAAALGRAAVRPEETELHFETQQRASGPLHHMVRLLGPPIARACTPRASHDWIHVNKTTEGLDISVDTTQADVPRGKVDVTGPTGSAVITIVVELLSGAPRPSAPHQPSGLPSPEVPTSATSTGRSDRRQQVGKSAEHKAAEQGAREAAKTVQPEAVEPGRHPSTSAGYKPAAAQQREASASASTARPTIDIGEAATRSAALRPREADGPLEVVRLVGGGVKALVPLEGGGRLALELSHDAARVLANALTTISRK